MPDAAPDVTYSGQPVDGRPSGDHVSSTRTSNDLPLGSRPSDRRSSTPCSDSSQRSGISLAPNRASGFVIHDEHGDKILESGRGVYEFRSPDGYEDEFWT